MSQNATGSPRAATGRALGVTLVALTAFTVLAIAAGPQQGAPEGAPISVPAAAMPPPLASGPIPDLELLFTAQVLGWIEPCG